MVSTSFLVAGVGVFGTILGAGISAYANLRQTKIQEEEQTKRTRAEFYIEYKVDVLTSLHKDLIEVDHILAKRHVGDKGVSVYNDQDIDHGDVEKLEELVLDIKKNILRAKPYLTDDEQGTLSQTHIYLLSTIIDKYPDDARESIENQSAVAGALNELDELNVDWDNYNNHVTESRKLLERNLGSALEDLEVGATE